MINDDTNELLLFINEWLKYFRSLLYYYPGIVQYGDFDVLVSLREALYRQFGNDTVCQTKIVVLGVFARIKGVSAFMLGGPVTETVMPKL